nr:EOG090X0AXR [Ilyocryptus agilis]
MRYLNQKEAARVDEELFHDYHFRIEQLMELAGLSCASAIADGFSNLTNEKVLVCVGPGNNGGDGLVCARHLKLFGYQPQVFTPKPLTKDLYLDLAKQCELFDIPTVESCPSVEDIKNTYSLIVDAIFGFSFKPPVRQEYSQILQNMIDSRVPVCSIDIPSGWDVENGPVDPKLSLDPEMLVSLTAPKMCARYFKGKFHYLGGRFVPQKLVDEYKLNLPPYPSTSCCVRLTDPQQ